MPDRLLRSPHKSQHRALHLPDGDILIMAPVKSGESSVLLVRPIAGDTDTKRPDPAEIAELICWHLNERG